MSSPAELDAEAIFAVLDAHDVRYVVIGGFAGVLHGLARATDDVDITPASDEDDLRRLSDALDDLDAALLAPDADEPVSWPWSPDSLRRFTTLTTRTRHGDLDIAFRPDGPRGGYDYDRLADAAIVLELDVPVPVAALEDVIASKRAAGRPKDLAVLTELQILLDRLRSR